MFATICRSGYIKVFAVLKLSDRPLDLVIRKLGKFSDIPSGEPIVFLRDVEFLDISADHCLDLLVEIFCRLAQVMQGLCKDCLRQVVSNLVIFRCCFDVLISCVVASDWPLVLVQEGYYFK